jgi:hypothetical protein
MFFSKHALLKIKERKIEKELVKKVIQEPEFLFYDIMGKCMIAISKVIIAGTETHLVVPFERESGEVKVVTAYPCRNLKKEIRRKEGKKWVRVR